MNKKIALDNLLELSQILESENVKWWLTDGTLLGLFRESDFISHDHDTDIGVDHKTFTKTSFSKIIKSGFKVEHIFGLWAESFEICFSKNGVKTDLFFFYKKDDLYYHSAFDNFNSIGYTRYDYNYQYFDTKWTKFLDEDFKIPEDPLLFIETKYGMEWRTPIKQWHWSTSPKNSVNTGIFVEHEISKLLFNKWLRS